MKHLTNFLLCTFLLGFLFPATAQETVKDFDRNVYKTVKAGTQVWMAENLKVSHYRNGDPIPNVKDPGQWKALTTGAYCDVNNNPANKKVSGSLYNWYSATDARSICPAGWHVPSDTEWAALVTFLSGEKGPGGVLPGSAEINANLFRLLPEPFRGYDGEFSHIGYGGGGWWSATSSTAEMAYYRNVNYNTVSRQHLEGFKSYGYNVRCVRD